MNVLKNLMQSKLCILGPASDTLAECDSALHVPGVSVHLQVVGTSKSDSST